VNVFTFAPEFVFSTADNLDFHSRVIPQEAIIDGGWQEGSKCTYAIDPTKYLLNARLIAAAAPVDQESINIPVVKSSCSLINPVDEKSINTAVIAKMSYTVVAHIEQSSIVTATERVSSAVAFPVDRKSISAAVAKQFHAVAAPIERTSINTTISTVASSMVAVPVERKSINDALNRASSMFEQRTSGSKTCVSTNIKNLCSFIEADTKSFAYEKQHSKATRPLCLTIDRNISMFKPNEETNVYTEVQGLSPVNCQIETSSAVSENQKIVPNIFTFNVSGSAGMYSRHRTSSCSNDAYFQPSPIYAQPYDALIDKIEPAKQSVSAIRASAYATAPIGQPVGIISAAVSGLVQVQRSVSVLTASGGIGPRSIIVLPCASSVSTARRRPNLSPLDSGYAIPHDSTPSPKHVIRRQSMEAFTFDSVGMNFESTGYGGDNEAQKVQIVTGYTTTHPLSHQITMDAMNDVRIEKSSSFFNDEYKQGGNDLKRPSSHDLAVLDTVFRELSSCVPPEIPTSAYVPQSFPLLDSTSSKTPGRGKISHEVTTKLKPESFLRSNRVAADDCSVNRISAYDNVTDQSTSSNRPLSHVTAVSDVTFYSQPWCDNLDKLTGYITPFDACRQHVTMLADVFAVEKDTGRRSPFTVTTGVAVRKQSLVQKCDSRSQQPSVVVSNEITSRHRECFRPPSRTTQIPITQSVAAMLTATQGGNIQPTVARSMSSNTRTIGRTGLFKVHTDHREVGGVSKSKFTTGTGTSNFNFNSNNRVLAESNDNFEYTEMESECGEGDEFFGMDDQFRWEDETVPRRNKLVPLPIIYTDFNGNSNNFRLTRGGSDSSYSQPKSPDVIPLLGM